MSKKKYAYVVEDGGMPDMYFNMEDAITCVRHRLEGLLGEPTGDHISVTITRILDDREDT